MFDRHAVAGVLLLSSLVPANAGGADIADRLAAANAERGQLAFQVCSACHTLEQGGPARIGPNLWGVVGDDVASREDFDYSDALRALGGRWTFERLDAFLAAPMDYAPGTRMVYPGVADASLRADVIELLRTHADTPLAKPAGSGAGGAATPATDPFGDDWPPGPGRDLTGFACQACHSLAIVKQQGLPRDRWDEMLDWMVEEQGMDPLEPEQREQVLEYLTTHFGYTP